MTDTFIPTQDERMDGAFAQPTQTHIHSQLLCIRIQNPHQHSIRLSGQIIKSPRASSRYQCSSRDLSPRYSFITKKTFTAHSTSRWKVLNLPKSTTLRKNNNAHSTQSLPHGLLLLGWLGRPQKHALLTRQLPPEY